MARKKSDGVNKSEEVRQQLNQTPAMSVKEVVATLGAKGIKVQPSLVYFIKGKLKQKKRKQISRDMKQAGVANPVDLILKVRGLAEQAGGMTKLKQLIDALAG